MTPDAARSASSDTPIDWEALARYLAGESSATERERVERHLAAHAGDAELVAALENAMRILALDEASEVDVESALQRVAARREAAETSAIPISSPRPVKPAAERTRSRPWRIAWIGAAAALLVFAARAVLHVSHTPGSTVAPEVRTFATAVGKTDSVRLPDGGRVVLGPMSQLTIAADYGRRVREVELHGEAYFEVVHDTTRPFTVRVGKATVSDIGTSFGVREDGAQLRIVVTSGSVLLRPDSGVASHRVLSAGDVGTVESGGRVSTTHDAATAPYLSWMHGTLEYRDAPLAEVSDDLHRWYGIVLQVDDSALAAHHIKGTFTGDPIDRVLQVIALDLGADVEVHGDTAILRPRRAQ
jgi:transmembrane sensor